MKSSNGPCVDFSGSGFQAEEPLPYAKSANLLFRRLSAEGFQDGVISPIRAVSLLGIQNMNYTGKSQSVNAN